MALTMDTVLLLHGFAATAGAWDAFSELLDHERYRPLAADLRGHGQNRSARPISFELCVADLLELAPARFSVVGYSLGGRIALQLALAAPERVDRLVLVSTTAGIEQSDEREARLVADLALADELEAEPIDQFADSWLRGPLFCDDNAEVNEAARREILKNSPEDLACALRGLSVGRMEPLWARLGELSMPTTVVAGALDLRYVALAERLSRSIAQAELAIIDAAGHALARSAPSQLAELL